MSKTTIGAVVRAEELRAFCSLLYQKAGVPREDADAVAEMQVETDLRGIQSHGTWHLPGFVRQILSGKLNPKPSIKVLREGPAFALLDGDRGFGLIVGKRAMEMAIQKAKTSGVAVVGVHNGGYLSAAGSFARMALDHGMIGFATECSGPVNAPNDSWRTGGMNPPMAYAFPTKEEPPLVLDTGCQFIYFHEVRAVIRAGIKVPVGWPLTEDGRIAYDRPKIPVEVPPGLLAMIKSYGLALVMGTLSCFLTGGFAVDPGDEAHRGCLFMAINVDSFAVLDTFCKEVDKVVRNIRSSKPFEETKGIYSPGEIDWRKREVWLQHGIPLLTDHLAALASIAKELGVKPFW